MACEKGKTMNNNTPLRYYRMLEHLHVGCEEPRAYFVPFDVSDDNLEAREKSSRFTGLCGEWDFGFFPNVEELAIEEPDFPSSVACRDKITVPRCWQTYTDRDYDVPNYVNQDYPFPVDPPHLPDVIPCGFYRRTLAVKKNADRDYFINFEGVAPCFYLWVNGVFIGYSQVSHCTSEFNITEALRDGDNTFAVLVVKQCDGSYLEDQDFFRLSGIFRDVYILERDRVHITDFFVDCNVSDDFNSAEITVKPQLSGEADVLWELLNPDGSCAQSGTTNGDFNITVENPALWNCEVPLSYTLLLTVGGEKIRQSVAVKRIEIQNRCLLLNGKKIKIYGINRHDSHPETGYAVSVEHMMRDLHLLKQANVNTIRTSHYPNDPRFMEMCEKLGFMMIDEADIETHGMGYNFGDWYWDHWAYLSDTPEWRPAYLDRAHRLFERDKNCGNVIMWSLGNESGCGENHRQMANYIRSRQPKAIIHYENAHLEYQEKVKKDFTDISDVESRMYASTEYLKNYLEDPESKKPFFYCEYVDSMSTGDIPYHWDNFEDYDNYCGGCVWEFTDHAVNIGTPENPKYRYGGDFGDWPNDGICCVDGVVYPDRTPRPGYYDMKITYQPLKMVYADGKLTVTNKRYFKNADDLYLDIVEEHNGEAFAKHTIRELNLSARESCSFAIGVSTEKAALVTLTVSIKQKFDTEWADADYEVGFSQFVLKCEPQKAALTATNSLVMQENRTTITVTCGTTAYIFSKLTGRLTNIIKNGENLLLKPMEFAVWRGCTYNSKGCINTWKRARYDHTQQKTYGVTVTENTAEKVVISADLAFSAAAMPPAIKAKADFTFLSNGTLNVTFAGDVTYNAPELPRFGIQLVLPKKYENLTYLGYGPQESYADRHRSAKLSAFRTTVTENFEHYIKPQECSSHYATHSAEITDESGQGLQFLDTGAKGFCFKALHYDDAQLLETMHDDELAELDETIVWLDYKIHSNNQGVAYLDPERSFGEKHFAFSYDII